MSIGNRSEVESMNDKCTRYVVHNAGNTIFETVKLLMLLVIANKRMNNHTNVNQHFQHEVKDKGLIQIEHVPSEENELDLFTTIFEKHALMNC